MKNLTGKDRLIVALDLPAVDTALKLVEDLDNVVFFKVGWELFIAGVTAGDIGNLWLTLQTRGRQVFIDLKVPPDIQNTIASLVRSLSDKNVQFLTLNEAMPIETIRAARAARGTREVPKLLMVPYLSSLDGTKDLSLLYGATDFEGFLRERAGAALGAGCDGVIASGETAIRLFRREFPSAIIVSPGIRPLGASHHDHSDSPRRLKLSNLDQTI